MQNFQMNKRKVFLKPHGAGGEGENLVDGQQPLLPLDIRH